MAWIYIRTPDEPGLFTTGFYDPEGRFQTDEDFADRNEARRRVAWLNGAKKPKEKAKKIGNYILTSHDRDLNY